MKLLSVLKHPVTQFNLLVLGFLGVIQIIHTHAHYKMEMDVHGYCKQYEMNKPREIDEYDEYEDD